MNTDWTNGTTGNLLVIGYGNELRGDDGAGPKVVERVAKWQLPGVRLVACHQLTPELVVPIAAAGEVIFVDAAQDSPDLIERDIVPGQSTQVMTHAVDPGSLMQLAQTLYGRCPPARWLTIPARDFSFGEKLSAVSRKAVQDAANRIRTLAQSRRDGNGIVGAHQKTISVRQPTLGSSRRGTAGYQRKELKLYARSSSRSGNH